MAPTITAFHVHDVVTIELSAVRRLGGDGKCDAFAARDVSFIDKEGQRLTITALCTGADGFDVRDLDFAEEPKCALPEPVDADRPKWSPSPMPRPHEWGVVTVDGNPFTQCRACGVSQRGALARLTCGTVANLPSMRKAVRDELAHIACDDDVQAEIAAEAAEEAAEAQRERQLEERAEVRAENRRCGEGL